MKYCINYRQITLTSESVELVGVFEKSGRIRHARFLGFISQSSARWLAKTALPVRLAVEKYSGGSGATPFDWIELKEHEYIQGCMVGGGVFAVICEGKPRVVTKY